MMRTTGDDLGATKIFRLDLVLGWEKRAEAIMDDSKIPSCAWETRVVTMH